MYMDSAYIDKFYLNEVDALAVRRLIGRADVLHSSSWAQLEVTSVFHRQVREGFVTLDQGRELMDLFRSHVESDVWSLVPVTEAMLRRATTLMRALPREVPLRAGDAIHLATALDIGEREIWTNDRHLLAAAPHFGIAGRSASA